MIGWFLNLLPGAKRRRQLQREAEEIADQAMDEMTAALHASLTLEHLDYFPFRNQSNAAPVRATGPQAPRTRAPEPRHAPQRLPPDAWRRPVQHPPLRQRRPMGAAPRIRARSPGSAPQPVLRRDRAARRPGLPVLRSAATALEPRPARLPLLRGPHAGPWLTAVVVAGTEARRRGMAAMRAANENLHHEDPDHGRC